MKYRFLMMFSLLAAVALTSCGLFDDDDNTSASRSDHYEGNVYVGLTDNVPASGTYVVQNIFNPNVNQIIAVAEIESARVGMDVSARWYQMRVFKTEQDSALEPEGRLFAEAGVQVERLEGDRAFPRLILQPTSRLPEDSYEVHVFIDGKLAKVIPFVVSVLVPGPAGTQPASSPTPQRTATP